MALLGSGVGSFCALDLKGGRQGEGVRTTEETIEEKQVGAIIFGAQQSREEETVGEGISECGIVFVACLRGLLV